MALEQAGLEWINKGLGTFLAELEKVSDAYTKIGGDTEQVGQKTSVMGGIITGVATTVTAQLLKMGEAAVGFAKDSIGMAASFQGAAARLQIAGRGAAASAGVELEKLREAALKVGDDTRLMGVSATGAAAALTDLLKAGLSLNDIMGDFNGYLEDGIPLGGLLASSINLAAASELDMVEASRLAATTMTIFGLSAEETAGAMDYIVRGADASVASVSSLRDGLEGAGPTLRALGFSLEDATDALALLSNAGLSGAEAGTALRSAFTTMASDKKKVVQAFKDMGISITDASGSFLSFREILGAIEQATDGMTEAQRRSFIVTIAGHYGQTAMNALLNQGIEGYDRYSLAVQNASGIMSQAQTMSQTFGMRMEALQGNIETLRIEIGDQFLPVMTDMVGIISGLVQEHGPAMVSWASNAATAIDSFVTAIQEIPDWVSQSVVQIGALVAAGATIVKLIPIITSVVAAIKGAVEGLMLFKAGFTLAEVSALGFSAVLIPLVASLAAVAAAVLAANKAIELHKNVTKETQKVTDAWTDYLKEQAEVQTTATGVVAKYAEKQEELNRIYEESPWYVKPFIDQQEILNADTAALSETLVEAASDYEDYRIAVEQVNARVIEAATTTDALGRATLDYKIISENTLPVLDEVSFALERGAQVSSDAGVAIRMMGTAAQTAAEEQIPEAAAVTAEMAAAAAAAEAAEKALAEATLKTWTEIASTVATGVDSYLRTYQQGQADLQAAQASGDQARIAKVMETNAIELQLQSEHLARILWNKTDALLQEGIITQNQQLEMRAALVAHYGVLIDETQLVTDNITRMFEDWASKGQTTADDIGAILGDLGTASEIMVANEEARILREIEVWNTRKRTAATYSDEVTRSVRQMADDAGVAMDGVVASTNRIEAALSSLTTRDWRIRVKGEYDAPPELRARSPQFAAWYELRDLAKLARTTPIEVKVATDVIPAAPPVMAPNNTYNTSNSHVTNVSVNATYGQVQSPASIYYDVQAALTAALL